MSESPSENCVGTCGDAFWRWPTRRGRRIPTAATTEPTPATGERPAARRGFAPSAAGALLLLQSKTHEGHSPSSRLARQPFPRKHDPAKFSDGLRLADCGIAPLGGLDLVPRGNPPDGASKADASCRRNSKFPRPNRLVPGAGTPATQRSDDAIHPSATRSRGDLSPTSRSARGVTSGPAFPVLREASAPPANRRDNDYHFTSLSL